MSASNRKPKQAVAKVMHWAVGVIILFQLLSGWRLGTFERDVKQVRLMVHSGVGTVIFLGMLFRWWRRKSNNLYAPPGWRQRPVHAAAMGGLSAGPDAGGDRRDAGGLHRL